MQPFHLQIFGYFTHLHFACQTRQQNSTQQPNSTQQSIFRSVTKGSAKKKGKQWTAENLSAPSNQLLKNQGRKKVSNGLLEGC
jgi:hypothetical protein